MKRLLLILVLIPFCLNVHALSGGPDKYGYTWKDSNEPGGPTYNWINILTSDRKVNGLGDDNVRGPFNFINGNGVTFRYYWYTVDKFWVGSNGYISFNNSMLASIFPSIPDSTDNRHNFISALLSDLTFSGIGNPAQCYYKDTWDSLIVSYINVPFYTDVSPSYTGSNTFQIILNKVDNSITVNFQSQSGTSLNNDVKTGIENLTGNIGLMPFSGQYPLANYTIRYYYPANPTYFVKDGAAIWNSHPGNYGEFIPYPGNFALKSRIGNTGNLDIEPPFEAQGRVKTFSGVNLINTNIPFTDTLRVLEDSIFNYLPSFVPPSAGTYSFVTRFAGVNGDQVHSNDSVTQELVAIDTSAVLMRLNYTDNSSDGLGVSWVDGTGGIAMYLVPPKYPAKVYNTKYFIESNPNGAAFIAKIYDDDGQGGSPGTLLDSVFVPASIVFVGGYNTVTPTHPVIIYSGGVYVAWEMYGTGIAIAKDPTPPISFNSWEFVGNIWSPYRSNQDEDFLIELDLMDAQIEDIGTARIVDPQLNDTLFSPRTVQAWLKNYGQAILNTFDVHYKMWGCPEVTQAYSGAAISPGDSVLFSFTTPLYNATDIYGDLCVWTSKMNDYDSHNDSSCVFINISHDNSGISEMKAQARITTYPNPFTDNVTVEFDNPAGDAYSMIIRDIYGKEVRAQEGINTGRFTITRGDLAPGIYFIELNGKKRFITKMVAE